MIPSFARSVPLDPVGCGGLINLNVHYHLLVPDGVFAEAGDGLAFVLLPVPTGADLLAILDRVIRQIARRLAKEAAGANDTDDADLPPDLFAQVQAEAATTWRSPAAATAHAVRGSDRLRAWCAGFSLHAGVVVPDYRRLSYAVGDGRASFVTTGARVQVIPQKLAELPLLRGFDDDVVLGTLASRFVQRDLPAGAPIVVRGQPAEHVVLIVHGKAHKLGVGKYGDDTILEVLAGGDHFGDRAVVESDDRWPFTVKAITSCTVLELPQRVFEEIIRQQPALQAHVERYRASLAKPQDKLGQAAIGLAAGHAGEPVLPGAFVDYDLAPREYELSVAQTVLKVHTRVSDLFNNPMNQLEQQLRLTIEALRERQEHEMINNREFGLLHNADLKQRLQPRGGPPTPDDLDELLCRRRKTQLFLAHPRTIAAFNQECTRRGVYPTGVEAHGAKVVAWRGVPLLPCDKIPISEARTSSILAMRMGVENQGVIGLHHAGLPDEVEPSLSVRRMDITDQAITQYLVTVYFSAAVMVPDALGILEDVQIGR